MDGSAALLRKHITVEPGQCRWYWIEVNMDVSELHAACSLLRLDITANAHVAWHTASRVEPGLVAMFEIAQGKMRTYEQGVTMSMRVEPAQRCYKAENVINGWSRPYRYTNLWRSNPSQPLDQWLKLTWKQAVKINQVELTFAGHLLREYHAYAPFYHDPQTVRAYTIEILTDDNTWKCVEEVTENYQRHRVHQFAQTYRTRSCRIVIHKTHGDPSAALYEIRCY